MEYNRRKMMHVKSTQRMQRAGYTYPEDKRKRRRVHRSASRDLLRQGGGGILRAVARWHRQNARYHGR
jgi:hypothetical protein